MSTLAALTRLEESFSNRPVKQPIEQSNARQLEIQLTNWPDGVRGVPNITLRSAIFSSSRSSCHTYLQRAEIYSQRPTQIRYTGPRLDQGDLDVWIALLHIARRKMMGKSFKTSAYELLKQQGKTDAGSNRKTLYKRLFRLAAATLEISATRYSYTGGLVDSIYRDEITHELVISLNPELSKLFGPNEFTLVDWSIRRSLNAKPLAQWLHGFLSSHAEPLPMSVNTIMMMAGSHDTSTSSREQNLRRALTALQLASNLHEQPFSYEICGGHLHIKRKPSNSQSRHLGRKQCKAK